MKDDCTRAVGHGGPCNGYSRMVDGNWCWVLRDLSKSYENPAKVLDLLKKWYDVHVSWNMMIGWHLMDDEMDIRELRHILYPNGGGDKS